MESLLFEENLDGLQIESSSQTSHHSLSNAKAFRSGMMIWLCIACHENFKISFRCMVSFNHCKIFKTIQIIYVDLSTAGPRLPGQGVENKSQGILGIVSTSG